MAKRLMLFLSRSNHVDINVSAKHDNRHCAACLRQWLNVDRQSWLTFLPLCRQFQLSTWSLSVDVARHPAAANVSNCVKVRFTPPKDIPVELYIKVFVGYRNRCCQLISLDQCCMCSIIWSGLCTGFTHSHNVTSLTATLLSMSLCCPVWVPGL